MTFHNYDEDYFCSRCQVWFPQEEITPRENGQLRCPDCSAILRTKPRATPYKRSRPRVEA
jgi:DNA-directed RNA polymerase subunit RPC12/RpoP